MESSALPFYGQPHHMNDVPFLHANLDLSFFIFSSLVKQGGGVHIIVDVIIALTSCIIKIEVMIGR